MAEKSLKLFDCLSKLSSNIAKIKGFPKVVVDQTNYRIGDIIKRNLAGEQVMGNMKNLAFDYLSTASHPNTDVVNPFSDIGFDLDDVIKLANSTGQKVTDLENRLGEIKQGLDQSKPVESPTVDAPSPNKSDSDAPTVSAAPAQ